MPQRNDRSRSTPTTSPKNNSWFRMQAGHQSDADIYIYDEIGFWGVTAKQFISDLNALGDSGLSYTSDAADEQRDEEVGAS